MKFLNMMVILSLMMLVSCSQTDKQEGVEGGGEDLASTEADANYVEYVLEDDEAEGEGDFILDDEGDDVAQSDSGGDDLMLDDSEQGDFPAITPAEQVSMSGEFGSYTVKKGDTLMLIAFNIYGDYRLWRKIRDLNPRIVSNESLEVGMSLKFDKPATPFEWNPQGLPYLIRRGDTLVSISNDKYGTSSKWRDLYENNRPMIKDPNLIFAGFTLYYIADERNLASEL